MRMKARGSARNQEQGSALVYILVAIALLALLTISFMQPSSQQTGSQNTFRLVTELQSQVDFIRSAVQECVLAYPNGDAGTLPPNPQVEFNHPFPISPNEGYYTTGCPAMPAAVNDSVQHLRCPGNPGSDNPCHAAIFGGSSGKFLPPTPELFTKMPDGSSGWQWYNGPDGIFFWIGTDKSDAYIQTALEKLNNSYGACEADIIDATAGAKTLDNAGTVLCPGGSKCFRLWMITDTDKTAPDDTETSLYPDEAACNTP